MFSLVRNGYFPKLAEEPFFRDFFSTEFPEFPTARANSEQWFAVDVEETDKAYILRADLPGVEQKDLRLEFQDGELRIEAHREVVESDQRKYLLQERRPLGFKRTFKLGKDVNSEAITANFSNGVLIVELAKAPEAQPRQIKITSSP